MMPPCVLQYSRSYILFLMRVRGVDCNGFPAFASARGFDSSVFVEERLGYPKSCRMVNGARKFIGLLIGVFSPLLVVHAASVSPVAHVIHVSVDGLAALYLQEVMASAPAEFPTFWRLVTNGASTFNARNDYFESITMPNHTSMLTGRPVLQPEGMPDTTHHGFVINFDNGGTLHTSGNPNLAYQASTFDVVHDHGLTTALLASKSKFTFYARSWAAENGGADVTGVDNGRGKIDFVLITEGATNPPSYTASAPLVDALLHGLSHGWNYSFIHFAETDFAGHYYGWGSAAWSNAVRHVDQQLGRILRAVEENPALSNSTAIILSTDHGGLHLYGHGNPAERYEYTIPLFVWRPGIPGGADAYDLVPNRHNPGTDRIDYVSANEPLRNGDGGNLALTLLGLPPVPGSLMVPQLGPMRFRLRIERAGQMLTVSWPAEAESYTLEASENCSPGAEWQPITDGIAVVGARRVYEVSAAAIRFYRLRK